MNKLNDDVKITSSSNLQINRIEILDVLRGIALMGILFINILLFSGYKFLPFDLLIQYESYNIDRVLYEIVEFVFLDKFYTIFSLLFGMGFYLQWERSRKEELKFIPIYKRRLFILLVIGLIHSLFWYSEILVLYSLGGFILIQFRNNKHILFFAILFFLGNLVLDLGIWFGFGHLVNDLAQVDKYAIMSHATYPDMTTNEITDILINGNAIDMFILNLHNLMWRWIAFIPTGKITKVVGLFLLGYYFMSRNIITKKGVSLSKIILLYIVGGGCTYIATYIINGSGFQFPSTPTNTLYKLLSSSGQIMLAFAYMVSISSLFYSKFGFKLLIGFSFMGRMALTNYILQSILCVLLFYNFGLSLIGDFGLVYILIIALVIFVVQFVLSKLWLEYYYYGPLEWVWRNFTYNTKFKFLKKTNFLFRKKS